MGTTILAAESSNENPIITRPDFAITITRSRLDRFLTIGSAHQQARRTSLGYAFVNFSSAQDVSKRYAEMREELKQHDKEDKLLDRERRKEKRMKQKMKLKRGRKEEEDDEGEEDLSGSDGEATRNRANKRSKKYFDSDSDDAERKRDKDKLAIKADSISLAEQEELALKLLSSMHS